MLLCTDRGDDVSQGDSFSSLTSAEPESDQRSLHGLSTPQIEYTHSPPELIQHDVHECHF